MFDICDVPFLGVPRNIIKKGFGFFLNDLKCLGVSKDKWYWCWETWSRPPGPKTMQMKAFRVFPKWILKVISSEWSRLIMWSFWAALIIISIVQMAPQTPQDPKSVISADFQSTMVVRYFVWELFCFFIKVQFLRQCLFGRRPDRGFNSISFRDHVISSRYHVDAT